MLRDDPDVVVKLKTETRGVVSPNIVRWIAFTVITISLVACTVLCILAIWKFTESDAVWRAIATFIVVSIATAIFTFVNEKLGERKAEGRRRKADSSDPKKKTPTKSSPPYEGGVSALRGRGGSLVC
jgi:Na+-transporting NADH:ubiquinone oxidoreductase subunit NqrB